MKTRLNRLDSLKKKKAQLESQIQSIEAVEKSKERKRDTRRKILIGSYFLDKAREEDSLDEIIGEMDTYLMRDSDRVLFDLEPKSEVEEIEETLN